MIKKTFAAVGSGSAICVLVTGGMNSLAGPALVAFGVVLVCGLVVLALDVLRRLDQPRGRLADNFSRVVRALRERH
ncbi:hypothetical protein [Cellulomonas sp. GbtcB1]|uniref:hypothetical protein n=1 Tax=Cellulomonas sp. GbtcB1 TaxID=2824746 RepID=UPI001C30A462|nr:hypothetical protein [Cellulomonas sp. GbtcB1]